MYLYSNNNKSEARDRYLVTGVDGVWCIKRFTGIQLRRTSYRVRVSNCYKVEGFGLAPIPYDSELEIDEDKEEESIPKDRPDLHYPACPPEGC